MAEYRKHAIPHPEWVDFPKNLPPGTPHYWMTRDRKDITPDPALDIKEFTIPARDGYVIRLRSYAPKRNDTAAAPSLPLFVYMHGGGFVTGSLETDDKSCRAIAKAVDVLILSVEYRLAPEHLFPTGFEDCWDVLKWAATTAAAHQLGVDLGKGFLVGGTSAGANFTGGLVHRYREEGLAPKITGLMFWCGSWCHPDVRPEKYRSQILSVDEIDDAPGLTKSSIEYYREKYGAPKDDVRYSPLVIEDWDGVADKAYFAICGWDPRRDEAIVYGGVLKDAGLEVESKIYSGLPHGFWTTCPDLPVSEAWENDTIQGVKWLLEKKE